MVFSRKPEPAPAAEVPPPPPPIKRTNERATAAHLGQVPPPGPLPDSIIGNDLSIEGQSITIRCKGTLRVNGTIRADLHSRALEVGRDAVIEGAIAADTVSVYGRVNGAILGAKVVLHSSAEVDGDIHSELLSIEQGASFDGRSRKVRNAAEVAPTLERSEAAAPGPHSASPVLPPERKLGPQPYGATERPSDGAIN